MIYANAPLQVNAIPSAVQWIEQALTGSVATAIAVIAVASLGFMAFAGRVNVRRVAQTLLGCFILFGAPAIAAGLQSLAASLGGEVVGSVPVAASNPLENRKLEATEAPPRDLPYDPYAGAAIAPR